MRIYSIKYLLPIFVRSVSKRIIQVCCVFLIVFSYFVWFTTVNKIKPVPTLPIHSVDRPSFRDMLDFCMLDNTPCIADIEHAINRYFPKLKAKFPMLLTYHPTIDCEHGRYLLLNNASGANTYHGTGSKLMWYLGVLHIAYELNLTVVHLDWNAEHGDDETNTDREKYWQFFDWEIPYLAYQSCPPNSSVKRNVFRYNLVPNQTLDQYHQGKKKFEIKPYFKNQFNQFTANLQNTNIDKSNDSGFTLYSSRTHTITSSLMELGVVFEARWWLQHRKLYKKQTGVWSGISVSSNYKPVDYFQYISPNASNDINNIPDMNIDNDIFEPIQCPSINVDDVLLIGVHIRHGDVVKRDSQGRIISGDLYRYIANSAYPSLLIFIINSLPREIQNKYLITIYSEGGISDFHDILNALKDALPESRCHVSFFLNGRTSETFNRLLRDDILISALSTFSMAAGIFNSRQLKLGPYHNKARVHGMRNHLSLGLTQNHTGFKLTEEKKQMIKQRINYVWKQKKAQQKTPVPLWIENYSSDYPERFMLI